MKEDELKNLIARVTDSVVQEVKVAEAARGISISDLREHAKEFGGGKLGSAWKISYDTSGRVIEGFEESDIAAWKISYDTSGKVLSQRGNK